MMKQLSSNQIAFWSIVLLVLIFVESFIFGNGNFIFIFLGAGLIYYGIQNQSKSSFIVGVIFILISLFSLWSLRILIFIVVINILIKMWQGITAEEIMQPIRDFKREPSDGLWKNKLFSVQNSPPLSYEWEDIHIQGFVSNIYIDVTNTVLPKGTSFISIRQGVGKVKIDLPYEVPVRIYYTTLFGEINLFDGQKKRIINESLHVKDGYTSQADHKSDLVITLATWAGDVEVIRK